MLYHNIRVGAHVANVADAMVFVAASVAGLAWAVDGPARVALLWQWAAGFGVSFVLAFAVVAGRMRLYDPWRTEGLAPELGALLECLIYSMGIATAAAVVLGVPLTSSTALVALGAGAAALLATRVTLRLLIRRSRRSGDDYRVWLIVGHNTRSAALVEEIAAHPHYGIRVAEVVDFDRAPADEHEAPGASLTSLTAYPSRRIQDAEELRRTLTDGVIDEVVILLPLRSCYDRIHSLLALCEEAGISVKLHPDQFEMANYRRAITHVGRVPMLTHYRGPSNYGQLVAKRLLDIGASSLALLILGLPLLAVGIAVRLSSPGPAFYRQQRVGLHGRHFSMIKFRSMYMAGTGPSVPINNERDGLAFKMKNDPRITPLGRVLRKFHIDELPQLWNVLVGDMSLVGPRPLPVHEATGHEWWQRRRLTVPPGLTCLWQVEDDPTIPFHEWMSMDMRYIDSWTFWLDIKIIARTFSTLARGKGW